MRDIKFRAWKPHNSLRMKPGMYQVSDLVWYDKPFQGNTGEVFYKGYKTSDYLEDVKLMQYTGLKDKNGVEIYEGDIVTGLAPWGATDVFYETHYAQFGGRDSDDFHPLNKTEASKYLEVIGNIYENKELLK